MKKLLKTLVYFEEKTPGGRNLDLDLVLENVIVKMTPDDTFELKVIGFNGVYFGPYAKLRAEGTKYTPECTYMSPKKLLLRDPDVLMVVPKPNLYALGMIGLALANHKSLHTWTCTPFRATGELRGDSSCIVPLLNLLWVMEGGKVGVQNALKRMSNYMQKSHLS